MSEKEKLYLLPVWNVCCQKGKRRINSVCLHLKYSDFGPRSWNASISTELQLRVVREEFRHILTPALPFLNTPLADPLHDGGQSWTQQRCFQAPRLSKKWPAKASPQAHRFLFHHANMPQLSQHSEAIQKQAAPFSCLGHFSSKTEQ